MQLAVEDNYIRQNISDNLLKELKSSHHYEDAHKRALNNTSYVHPDTKKKIFKAVGQLSYRPNLLAKGLKQGIGVLRVLKESGKKVPEEVMVISLTGHAIGGMLETAMTSMELPGREMGQRAADMILEDIEAADDEKKKTETEKESPKYFDGIESSLTPWLENKSYTQSGFTIQDMAKTLGTNRTYLNAYIKDKYHATFREWITGLRLEYAKNILKEHPEINIQKLAESSGFLSRSNFIKSFTEKESPS